MPSIYFENIYIGEPCLSGGKIFYPIIKETGRTWKSSNKWWAIDFPPPPIPASRVVLQYFDDMDKAQDFINGVDKG